VIHVVEQLVRREIPLIARRNTASDRRLFTGSPLSTASCAAFSTTSAAASTGRLRFDTNRFEGKGVIETRLISQRAGGGNMFLGLRRLSLRVDRECAGQEQHIEECDSPATFH